MEIFPWYGGFCQTYYQAAVDLGEGGGLQFVDTINDDDDTNNKEDNSNSMP